jgi:hypothetical protein
VWRRLYLSASLGVTLLRVATGAVDAKNLQAKATNSASSAPSAISVERGDELFRGQEPLTGRIRGHDDDLPSEVVRCVNCHGAAPANASTQRLSRLAPPRLDSALLLEFHQRRGGPPSRYDPPAFCKLLRTGVDPAHILIAREMPAYDIDDAQCASLWAYALAKERDGENPAAELKETPAEKSSAKP